jgi:hypothetical protein
MQPTVELFNQKLTSEAYTEPSIKIGQTPDIPWKPQCGKNQLRGGFIMGFQENLQQQKK